MDVERWLNEISGTAAELARIERLTRLRDMLGQVLDGIPEHLDERADGIVVHVQLTVPSVQVVMGVLSEEIRRCMQE